jgi:cytochrome c oxidase assembly protein subunit 15
MSPQRIARFAWWTLAANIGVILWGAYVRATGSGAGCGSHWPLCNGEIIPRAPSVETLIEYSHRITSGLALLLVVALLVLARRGFEKGHPARTAALASMVLMLTEAGIGAGLVLFELVADNASMARGLFMATHLGNTFLLLAALTLTAHWAGGAAHPTAGRGRALRGLLAAALLGTILVGMSGAVAALGDTLFPAESLTEALRQDLSPTSHLLIQLRVYHPFIAVAVSLLLLHFLARLRSLDPPPETRRHADRLNLLIYVQLAAGTLNIVLLAPIPMQILHLLLADFVWILLVRTAAGTLALPADGSSQ